MISVSDKIIVKIICIKCLISFFVFVANACAASTSE